MNKQNNFIKTITYIILVISSIGFLLPIVWMISTSLKSYEENLSYIPSFFSKDPNFENYKTGLFTFIPFFKYFKNSLFLVVVGTLATLFTSTMVAYGFARNNSKKSKVLFFILLATMMLPTQTTMISSYVIWARLNLVDTYVPLLITTFFGGSPFYIFLLKQFISTIPIELEEAAIIDGASRFQIYTRIILPLLKPALAAVSIFSFQAIWNDYMGPLIYIKSESKYTLAQALTLFKMPHETLWGPMMSASIVSLLPIILMFVFFHKYFIGGITQGGVKS